jgi:hypothetical protein
MWPGRLISPGVSDKAIRSLHTPVNAARISTLPSIATQDTTLYNAIVRSEALFFFNRNKAYPLFHIEVLNHHCVASLKANRFVKTENVDTVYSCYFSLDYMLLLQYVQPLMTWLKTTNTNRMVWPA